MGKKVVTLGEIMLRLSTPGNTRFVQSDSFDVVYGGGEANVAVSCANYGHDAYFVTKLPKHEIGQSAVNALRKYGVKTDFIARGGDRVGIYYLTLLFFFLTNSHFFDITCNFSIKYFTDHCPDIHLVLSLIC